MSDHVQMWEELGLDVELHEKVLASIGASYKTIITSQENRPGVMGYFDTVIHEAHGGRVREILDAKSEGRKMLGTFCIYVPDEIAMAASAIPVALCGGTSFSIPYAETMFPRDICPLVKSTLGLSFSKTCPYGPIKDMAVVKPHAMPRRNVGHTRTENQLPCAGNSSEENGHGARTVAVRSACVPPSCRGTHRQCNRT